MNRQVFELTNEVGTGLSLNFEVMRQLLLQRFVSIRHHFQAKDFIQRQFLQANN